MPTFSIRAISLLLLCLMTIPSFAKEVKKITNGSTVTIEYTMSLEDGKVLTTNVGKEPLEFVQGKGKVFPTVEKALIGLKVNDSKEFTLTPQQAFGQVNPNKIVSVKPETVPENSRKIGAELVAAAPNGAEQVGIVKEILPDRIVLNFNHPLAGQTLKFKAKVLSIK